MERRTLTPPGLVLHSDDIDIAGLKALRDNVSSSLTSGQSDVSTRLTLVLLAQQIATTTETARRGLNDASAVENSADPDQLTKTIDSLESTVGPQLDSLQSVYERLPDGVEGDELRASTLGDLSQLREWLLTLLQSLRDRRDALAEFNTAAAQLEAAIDAVEDRARPELDQQPQPDVGEGKKKKKKGGAKAESPPQEQPTADQLSARVQLLNGALNDLEATRPQIDAVRALAESLRPSDQPQQRVDAAEARKDQLSGRIQAALAAAQTALDQMQLAARDIDDLAAALEQVEKTTEQVEATNADRSSSAPVLDAQLAVIGEPLARVDAIAASVNELSSQPLGADQKTRVAQLDEKAKQLSGRLAAAKQSMETWLALLRDYDQAKQPVVNRLADLEAETAAIDAKYHQARPVTEAAEDARTIQSLLSAVQDERARVNAVADLAGRLDGRFEAANETASYSDRVEGLDAHLTVSAFA